MISASCVTGSSFAYSASVAAGWWSWLLSLLICLGFVAALVPLLFTPLAVLVPLLLVPVVYQLYNKLMTTWLPTALEKMRQIAQQVNEMWNSFDNWYQGLTPEQKSEYQADAKKACAMFAEVLKLIWLFWPKDAKQADDKTTGLSELLEKLMDSIKDMMGKRK